ncbi:MAG TPA: 3-deoxy-7-phosphoheptulonate synthase [Candidatus Limnocylindrales bacterium]|nr:3-deoxy-7-phosphoheptulonate synthase [Candidatus Limnocylindrales bacterium]
MLIVMQQGATDEQVQAVMDRMIDMGFNVHRSTGVVHTLLGGVGGKEEFDLEIFRVMEGVKEAHRIISPYKLASRHFRPGGTVVKVGNVEIGGAALVTIAGPARVESAGQIALCAQLASAAGAQILRGDATRPEGLRQLRDAADRYGLAIVSEAGELSEVDAVSGIADMLAVSPRNMQHGALLRAVGTQRKPVLLKRGIAATVEEWLLAAEQILSAGNYNVVLCESGIRTFETYTRYTMDLSAIPVVKKLSHLPIIADPCHATGRRDKVAPMARAAIAAGADGLLLEVHPDPDRAESDGAQSLSPAQFDELMRDARRIGEVMSRR